MIAFGGGVLISAVALVLVPDGVKELTLGWIVTAFVAGAIVFWGLETLLARSKSSIAQLVAKVAGPRPVSESWSDRTADRLSLIAV